MNYLDFRGLVDFARAHGHAVHMSGARQVFVTIQMYKYNAKVYSFPVCFGHCPKCDRIWIDLRRELSSIEVVQVGATEPPAPTEPESLPNGA